MKCNNLKEAREYLEKPFPPNEVKILSGFAYINARAVMHRLTDVCGSEWSSRIAQLLPDGNVVMELTLFDTTRSDIGYEVPTKRNQQTGELAQNTLKDGFKGSASDALKRAAVSFGVGAYLYSLPQSVNSNQAYAKWYHDQTTPKAPITEAETESFKGLAKLAGKTDSEIEAYLPRIHAGNYLAAIKKLQVELAEHDAHNSNTKAESVELDEIENGVLA